MKSLLPRLLIAAGLVFAAALHAADAKLVVAFLPKSKGNAYFISCKAGADKAAKELGLPATDIPTSPSRGKETFFDGTVYDPANPQAYLDSLKIKG